MTPNPGDSPWFRNYGPAPDACVRLVCLPHAGGSASFYFPLARALSPKIEVLAVQYPGRQDRHAEPCVQNIEDMADRIAEALGPWTDRPYALFGHSMGAMVGFEVARRMEASGKGPLELFVSGRQALRGTGASSGTPGPTRRSSPRSGRWKAPARVFSTTRRCCA